MYHFFFQSFHACLFPKFSCIYFTIFNLIQHNSAYKIDNVERKMIDTYKARRICYKLAIFMECRSKGRAQQAPVGGSCFEACFTSQDPGIKQEDGRDRRRGGDIHHGRSPATAR